MMPWLYNRIERRHGKKGGLRNVRLRNEKLLNRQPLFWCKNIVIPETTVADPLSVFTRQPRRFALEVKELKERSHSLGFFNSSS